MKAILLILSVLILTACATVQRQAQLEQALELSKNHFYRSVAVRDDALDTVATITSRPGLQEKRGILSIVRDANFLRAFIDKKTGATTFQVYNVVYYGGRGWNFYYRVNYETPNGPVAESLIKIDTDVNCSGSRYGGCTHTEDVAFEVDEKLLEWVAAKYSPGQRTSWKYKLGAKSGVEYPDGLLPAEVAGFLDFIHDYKASRGLLKTK